MFVKICGITNPSDALLCAALGSDAIGLVFTSSSRQVTIADAKEIVSSVPEDLLTTGVFKDEPVSTILDVISETKIKAVQLHGSETPYEIAFLKKHSGVKIIKAFDLEKTNLEELTNYGADIVLFDTDSPGTGKQFRHELVRQLDLPEVFMVAGGLTPDNVESVIAITKPWGVDVSSGVESSPGIKDPRKLRSFIVRAKEPAQQN